MIGHIVQPFLSDYLMRKLVSILFLLIKKVENHFYYWRRNLLGPINKIHHEIRYYVYEPFKVNKQAFWGLSFLYIITYRGLSHRRKGQKIGEGLESAHFSS